MIDRNARKREALELARRALELLDQIGELDGSVHLQSAVNALTGVAAPQSLAEVDALLLSAEGQRLVDRLVNAPAPACDYATPITMN